MGKIVLLLTTLALPLVAAGKKPNILFIAVDDLNDWIGCMGGHPQTITPNFDRLAKSGVLFTNAHCTATACNPSRTAIMTGISPHKSGMYSNRQIMREILPTTKILPQHFRDNGYEALGSGKMLHYFTDAASWDDYFPPKETENPIPKSLDPPNRPFSLPRGGPWQYVDTDWGPVKTTDKNFGGDFKVTEYVNNHLSKKHEKPFFLACGIYRPHEPWFVPEKYFAPFPLEKIQLPPGYKADDLDDIPPGGQRYANSRYFKHILKEGQWKKGIQGYLASIHFADAMLGRVLDTLENGPNAGNTIVILWSDHGWQLGEKNRWQKYSPWRAVTRVPLMIRVPKNCSPSLPEGTNAGTVCRKPVNLLSIQPTLISLSGVAKNPNSDGPDLTPLLKKPQGPWPHVSTTFLQDRGAFAISTGFWRYIRYQNDDEEFYDIRSDPYEWNNLAGNPSYQKTLAEIRNQHSPKSFAEAREASFESLPILKWHPALSELPASKPDGGKFPITFFNRSPGTIICLTPEGNTRVILKSGEKKKSSTRPGSVWQVLTADSKKQLGYFVVDDRKAKAIIPPKK